MSDSSDEPRPAPAGDERHWRLTMNLIPRDVQRRLLAGFDLPREL